MAGSPAEPSTPRTASVNQVIESPRRPSEHDPLPTFFAPLDSAHSLRVRYMALMEDLLGLNSEVDEGLKTLDRREAQWNVLIAKVQEHSEASQAKVNLNVGGRAFTTSRENLLRWEGTYFHALLGSGEWQPCSDGAYFIDRDPDLFSRVMSSMRSGKPIDLGLLSEAQISDICTEVDYYQLPRELLPCNMPKWEELRWDAARCSEHLAISEGGRTVTKTGGGNGWNAASFAATPNAPRFQVRIRSSICNIMVGYARSEEGRTGQPNYNRSGWFIQCGLGNLYSGFGDSGRAYRAALRQGDLLEVQYDRVPGHISFTVNGMSHGVAFAAVGGEYGPLLPCVECYNPGASVSLES